MTNLYLAKHQPMDKLSDLAVKIAKSHDIKQEMDAAFALKKLEDIIKEVWGTKGTKNLKPKKIVFNKAFVKASNSAWAQEFQLQKHEILSKLNQTNIKKVLEINILI